MSRTSYATVVLNVFNVLRRGEETTPHAIQKEIGHDRNTIRRAIDLLCEIFSRVNGVELKHRMHGPANVYQYVEGKR